MFPSVEAQRQRSRGAFSCAIALARMREILVTCDRQLVPEILHALVVADAPIAVRVLPPRRGISGLAPAVVGGQSSCDRPPSV